MADGSDKSAAEESLNDSTADSHNITKFRIEVGSLEEAMQSVRDYELSTTTRFTSRGGKLSKFGHTSCDLSKHHKIMWEERRGKGEFHGKPFVVVNSLTLECSHAPDRHTKLKEKLKQKRDALKANDPTPKKPRKPKQSKKIGCPALVRLKEVIYFNDYKIPTKSSYLMQTMSKKLRTDLKSDITIRQERKIIVHFPSPSEHQNHIVGESAGSLQNIDERLKTKIGELVATLITDTKEVKKHLEHHVKDVLFRDGNTPDKTNRRFFPTDNDIHNHVTLARRKLKNLNIDQEHVEAVLRLHSDDYPDHLVYFRPSTNVSKDTDDMLHTEVQQTLLVVYQTSDQKRLLALYGNDTCLLDATYKTTVPLYFVCVKTNVDYQTVGMFILEKEQSEHVREGLQVLRDANPSWNPTYFITDFNDYEINAIENVFSGCHVYLCDFHREQAWRQWLTTKANGVLAQADEALARFRRLARAQSEEALHIAYVELQKSELWTSHPKLQNWFATKWYPQLQRWVMAFRKDAFIFGVHTNNGIEGQNECLKQQYLKQKRNNTLSSLIVTMIELFFPEQYQKYQIENLKLSNDYMFKLYSKDVPDFLRDRPSSFVMHCMQRIQDAQYYTLDQIVEVGSKVFQVRSESQPQWYYTVMLGTENQFPSCECSDWQEKKLLCKHFFAVFANTKYRWDDVSELYRSSKYFCLDNELIDAMASKSCSDYSGGPDNDMPCSPPSSPGPENSKLLTALTALPNQRVRKSAALCRGKLQDLINLTYDIVNESTLVVLNDKLADISRWLGAGSSKHFDAKPKQDHTPKISTVTQRRTSPRLTRNARKIRKRKKDDSDDNEADDDCQNTSVVVSEDGEVIGEVIAELIVGDPDSASEETSPPPKKAPKTTTSWIDNLPSTSENQSKSADAAIPQAAVENRNNIQQPQQQQQQQQHQLQQQQQQQQLQQQQQQHLQKQQQLQQQQQQVQQTQQQQQQQVQQTQQQQQQVQQAQQQQQQVQQTQQQQQQQQQTQHQLQMQPQLLKRQHPQQLQQHQLQPQLLKQQQQPQSHQQQQQQQQHQQVSLLLHQHQQQPQQQQQQSQQQQQRQPLTQQQQHHQQQLQHQLLQVQISK